MFRRLSTRVLATLLVASMLVVPGAIVALGAEGGTGPADALSPTGEWMPLANGQQVWYAFNYDGGDTAILVRMGVSPSNSATFSVWTPENVRRWAAGEKPNPIGRGVKNDQFGGDLVWTGSFKFPGTYYVLVEQTGGTAGSYKLDISGKGVSFPPAGGRNNCRCCARGEAGGCRRLPLLRPRRKRRLPQSRCPRPQ